MAWALLRLKVMATAVPTTFFVDSDGQILDTVIGAMEKDAWKEAIDAYLEE